MPAWNRDTVEKAIPSELLSHHDSAVDIVYGQSGSLCSWQFGSLDPTSERLFELGSLTKVFTSALLWMLAKRGTVKLSDYVSLYIDDAALKGSNVTLLDLANHRSNLPRLPDDIPVRSKDPYCKYSRDQLLRSLRNQTWRTSGSSAYLYSNYGYAVLGLVLELATGQSYTSLIEQRILKPWGLNDTYVVSDSDEPGLVNGYDISGHKEPFWHWQSFAPCGGIVSSAGDVGRLLAQIASEADMVNVGWHIKSRIAWQNGQTAGFSSYASLNLDTGQYLVVLANTAGQQLTQFGISLENTFFFGTDLEEHKHHWTNSLRNLSAMFFAMPWWLRYPIAGGLSYLMISLVEVILSSLHRL